MLILLSTLQVILYQILQFGLHIGLLIVGANDHMVGKDLVFSLSNYIVDSTTGLVKLPNGHATCAAKLGSVRLTNT